MRIQKAPLSIPKQTWTQRHPRLAFTGRVLKKTGIALASSAALIIAPPFFGGDFGYIPSLLTGAGIGFGKQKIQSLLWLICGNEVSGSMGVGIAFFSSSIWFAIQAYRNAEKAPSPQANKIVLKTQK